MTGGAGLGAVPTDWILLPVSGAAALAVYYWLWLARAEPSWSRTGIKTGSVAILAALAPATMAGTPLLAATLGLCALGDACLSRPGRVSFLAGVGTFALGHVGYVGVFLYHPEADPSALVRVLPVVGIPLLLVALGMMALLFRRAGDLRWAVLAYVPIVTGMAYAAFVLPGIGPLALVPLAALCFLISDAILALELFILRPGGRAHRLAPALVWPLYWLAQFGFFWSLAWAGLK